MPLHPGCCTAARPGACWVQVWALSFALTAWRPSHSWGVMAQGCGGGAGPASRPGAGVEHQPQRAARAGECTLGGRDVRGRLRADGSCQVIASSCQGMLQDMPARTGVIGRHGRCQVIASLTQGHVTGHASLCGYSEYSRTPWLTSRYIRMSSCAQVASGVATAEEAEACISSEFNPVRAGFRGSADVWTRDVLNLGVRPDKIIAKARPTLGPPACR